MLLLAVSPPPVLAEINLFHSHLEQEPPLSFFSTFFFPSSLVQSAPLCFLMCSSLSTRKLDECALKSQRGGSLCCHYSGPFRAQKNKSAQDAGTMHEMYTKHGAKSCSPKPKGNPLLSCKVITWSTDAHGHHSVAIFNSGLMSFLLVPQ